MAEPVKRRYRAPHRAAAAAETRARIRAAATELFVARGYAATTVREIAARAGVGERTIYDAFPSKAALFGHTLDVATVGDEQRVAVADRPEILAAQQNTDPEAAIEQLVEYIAKLLERAGGLIMASVEAAGADPDMRAAADAGSRATHQVCLAFARSLRKRSALRDGLHAGAAADILYALTSPHMHQLLRTHRGWSARRYQAWLRDTVTHQLLG